jgi:hypothetical protein
MREIASTFREAGLPGGFHEAAAEVYRRMAGFKDGDQSPQLEEVLTALLENHEKGIKCYTRKNQSLKPKAGLMKKVSIENKQYILEDVFKVEEVHLRYEKFNGRMSEVVRRISLERGDSVAVLIFNLTTEKIILVNQFRYPSYKNGHGWITEIIAGIVDPGETPEEPQEGK